MGHSFFFHPYFRTKLSPEGLLSNVLLCQWHLYFVAMDTVCFCRKKLISYQTFSLLRPPSNKKLILNISFPSNRKLVSFQKIKGWKQERKKKIEKSEGDAIIFIKIHISEH